MNIEIQRTISKVFWIDNILKVKFYKCGWKKIENNFWNHNKKAGEQFSASLVRQSLFTH